MPPRTPNRWILRDPDKPPPKSELPEDVRGKSLAERKAWWLQYLKWTDSPMNSVPDADLTPAQLQRRRRTRAAWRDYHATGDRTYLLEAGLVNPLPTL